MLVVAALVAGLAIISPAASARTAAPPAPNADIDGDRVFENLSARLGKLAAEDRLSVIVRLSADLTSERIAALERSVGGFELTRSLPIVDGFAATMTKAQAEALAESSSVAAVEEDGVVRGLNDSAQESFGVTKVRTDIPGLDGDTDGDPATYSKRDLVVAVVDSGIDATHPQLDDGKVLAFVDCSHHQTFPDPSTCFARDPFDDNDHGTHIAGTVAGDGEGDPTYKGVAPGAALVGVKVLRADNTGTFGAIVSGIQWVVENRHRYGIEAINISLAGNRCSDGTDVLSDAAEAAIAAGLIVVAGAGNQGPGACTVDGPAAAPNVIAVGAMVDTGLPRSGEADLTRGFFLARFSSRGPTLDGRIKPDIVAPGVVTSANANNANNGTDPYVTFLGTSMAAPFVVGVALLMLEANSDLSHAEIKSILMSTAVDWGLGGTLHEPGSSGADVDYGAGRLDAFAAIKAAGAPLGTGPPVPAHTLFSGTLAAGASVQHSVAVSDTSVPLAGTMIMPRWSNAADPDFNLLLRDPDGAIIGTSARQERQDTVAARVTRTGTYTFEVSSVAGSGPYVLDVSGGSVVAESPVAPGAPTSVSAVAAPASATVSWVAPASDGRSPITNYVVTPYVGATAQAPTTVGNVTQAVIRGLKNGTVYTFTVRARNAVGDGAESTRLRRRHAEAGSPTLTAAAEASEPSRGGRVRRPPRHPSRSRSSPDPLLAALVDLFLPERHRDLQLVDRLVAGGESVAAMRRGDGDDDARLADVDSADAVVDRDLAQLVLRLQRGRELGHHLLGHALVGLVLEVEHVAAARAVARVVPRKVATAPASSSRTSPTTASSDSGASESRKSPPETGGITATSSPAESAAAFSAYPRFSA